MSPVSGAVRDRRFKIFSAALLVALAAVVPLAQGRSPAAPAHSGGFWNRARISAALSNERGFPSAPQRPSAVPATASSLRVGESSGLEDRAFGRIFGFDPHEGPYSCSGTSLATPSGSIVLTAGHCIVENYSWGLHLIFVPAFDHHRRPFGTFSAETLYTTPQWRRSENSDFDVAAIRVRPGATGTLTETVGAHGYETGKSRFSSFQIFGYPAAALHGEELRSCSTRGLGSDRQTNGLSGPPTLPAGCDMAAGSSGGPWIVDGQYVDGVTSYGYLHHHGRLYSPYFGAVVGRFLSHLP
jgi:V8-like Glu-specific endopeptidase